MSKTFKTIAEVVGIAALAVVTAGAGAAIAAGASLGTALSASAFGLSTLIGSSIAGSILEGAALLGAASLAGMAQKKPKASASQMSRLLTSLSVDTPRTLAFGETALSTDVRYEEWWGSDQQYFSEVILCASHWCEAIEAIYLNDELAWTVDGGAQGTYVGYFFVGQNAQATSSSVYTNDWSNRWGANAVFVGCATLYLQFKVTGNSKKATSPFSSSIPTRITVKGKGARFYDPRFDSTVPGGSGPMRADDQSTWAWTQGSTQLGRNNALALLFYLLGWRIQNPSTGAWKLAVGCGIPANRINMASFITAANLCDEMVYKGDGTQEPRYRCDGVFSEGDNPADVIGSFEASMNGKLRDWGGFFSLQLFHDDLAAPVLDFTADDVLGPYDWDAGSDIPKNVVKGKYVDPSTYGLYQSIDYPTVSLGSLDGIDRTDNFDCPLVQSPDQAQRLAKMRLERMQYPGAFSASFNAKGWGVKDGDVVRLTFPRTGFNQKVFRVALATVDVTGVSPLQLTEENAAIYAAFSDTRAAIVPAAPNTFDPLMLPLPQAIDQAGQTAVLDQVDGAGALAGLDTVNTDQIDPNAITGSGRVLPSATFTADGTWKEIASFQITLSRDGQADVTGNFEQNDSSGVKDWGARIKADGVVIKQFDFGKNRTSYMDIITIQRIGADLAQGTRVLSLEHIGADSTVSVGNVDFGARSFV